MTNNDSPDIVFDFGILFVSWDPSSLSVTSTGVVDGDIEFFPGRHHADVIFDIVFIDIQLFQDVFWYGSVSSINKIQESII